MSLVSSPIRNDLIAQFEVAARTAAAAVERIPYSAGALSAAVGRIAKGKIAIAEPQDLPSELFADLRRLPGVITSTSKQDLASCDVGVTEAFAAVARTGSVCVTVDHAYGGVISLLTRRHIAVVAGESIVQRPADLFSPKFLNGKGLQRSFVFITGPSATADMGPLVRGVHGSHSLHILVLE